MKMETEKLQEILAAHKTWLEPGEEKGKRANLREADLRGADLGGADLREADLRGADLGGANLRRADLGGANLRRANLRGADLREANTDFACWPLWCGSLRAKVGERIARQLMYHAFAVGIEFFPGGLTEAQKKWLQEFEHATDEVNSKM
jgi:hypothetical protein